LTNPIILIVEDNDRVRKSLREWLERAFPKYQFIEAASGEEAINITQARAPCAIIMDISLPGMRGIEATRHVKGNMPTTQVVILTIHEEEAFRADAKAAGASAFVTKRVMRKELVPALAAVLATHEGRETSGKVRIMKRPDLLLLVAIWAFLSAFLYLISIAAIAIFALPEALGFGWGPASIGSIFGISIGVLILLCSCGLSLAAGIGILQAKNWGRIISIIVAVLSLFWIPVGTVLGVLVLIYLMKAEVREYFEGSH